MRTAVLVIGYAITLGALIDALRRPAYDWVVADRNRGYWIAGLGFGLLLLPVGIVLAIGYAIGVLPRLSQPMDSDFRRRP
jgi:hypothetical protein